MEQVKKVMQSMGALPKLRLGEKIKGSGVKSFGPKTVKFLAEPVGVSKKDFSGKQQKMMRFEVEHEGTRYFWYVRVLNQEGEVNYLMERLAEIKVGDERVLEMTKQGARNYVDIRMPGDPLRVPELDEGDEDFPDEEEGEVS